MFLSPATNVEPFILLDETFVKVTALNHVKANSGIKKQLCIYLKGGEYLCIYFFLCIYLFINPVITMVTAEVNCVSAQQQPRRWEGRVSDERDRSPARLRRLRKDSCRVKNDTLDHKKKVCIFFL